MLEGYVKNVRNSVFFLSSWFDNIFEKQNGGKSNSEVIVDESCETEYLFLIWWRKGGGIAFENFTGYYSSMAIEIFI